MPERTQYELVAEALRWIAVNQSEQPDLQALSVEMGVSRYHLQRVFQDWAGVTPKQFLKSLTRQAALERLRAGEPILETSIAAGLSGPGRLHDLMITTDALTPGEARKQGQGVELRFGYGDSPFGRALIAWSPRGICFLGFCGDENAGEPLEELQKQWRNAEFVKDPAGARQWLTRVFEGTGEKPLPLWLRGSPFQLKVWEALLAIPENVNVTYGQLATLIGRAGAAQAVGGAVGSNPLAWIIPCHRVIRQLGELGGYRWGLTTKSAMIGMEASRYANPQFPHSFTNTSAHRRSPSR